MPGGIGTSTREVGPVLPFEDSTLFHLPSSKLNPSFTPSSFVASTTCVIFWIHSMLLGFCWLPPIPQLLNIPSSIPSLPSSTSHLFHLFFLRGILTRSLPASTFSLSCFQLGIHHIFLLYLALVCVQSLWPSTSTSLNHLAITAFLQSRAQVCLDFEELRLSIEFTRCVRSTKFSSRALRPAHIRFAKLPKLLLDLASTVYHVRAPACARVSHTTSSSSHPACACIGCAFDLPSPDSPPSLPVSYVANSSVAAWTGSLHSVYRLTNMAHHHYRSAPTMSSDVGNNRQTGYHAYLGAQAGNGHQHEMSNSHGHHVGHPSDTMGAVLNQFSTLTLPSGPNMSAGTSIPQAQAHHGYCATQDQQVAYPGYPVPMHVGMAPDTAYPFSVSGQYPVQSGYAPVPVPYHAMSYTPGRIASYGDRTSDVPGLENGRGSYSTTESTPGTPFFGNTSERGSGGRVAVIRSTYSTPSSDQMMVPTTLHKAPAPVDEDLVSLLKQDPVIPDAVPAVFTPPTHTKSIEQCLENRINGNRNVYIRGLHPTTDDDLLQKYASRFGPVEQSKAIIDTSTGACKGFGFAKFADVRDSEKCIRGFYHLGYEVGFARESFNARLKAEGDESSTNLYLSNLPKRLTESELNAIFTGYHVVSSKILRDSMGNSRGVGFARFESRDECEDIIKKYHGASIGEEGMLMQVRYADTPAQKELKRITAERRQFRTNEYNIGAYGTADVGIHPSIYQQAPWNRRASAGVGVGVGVNATFAPRVPVRATSSGGSLPSSLSHAGGRLVKQSNTTTTSDNGSADESVTVVGSPTVAKQSTQSSPTIKKERA